jgi:hypothetical protein
VSIYQKILKFDNNHYATLKMRVRYFFFYGYADLQFRSAISAYSDSRSSKLFLKNPLYKWETQLEEVTPRSLWKEVVRHKIKARSLINEIHPNFYLYDWYKKEVIARPIR